MYACGRRSDRRDYSKLCAGSRATVHEAVQDAGPRRFANSGSNARNRQIGIDIHTLMIDEVLRGDNLHADQ
jgi:hypothetical protein